MLALEARWEEGVLVETPVQVGSRAEPPSGREGCLKTLLLPRGALSSPFTPGNLIAASSHPKKPWNMVGSWAVIQKTCYHHPGGAEPSTSHSPAVV